MEDEFETAPEVEMWRAVVRRVFMDCQSTHDGIYLSEGKQNLHHTIETLVRFQKQKLIHDIESEWMREILLLIDHCYIKFRRKCYDILDGRSRFDYYHLKRNQNKARKNALRVRRDDSNTDQDS